MRAQSTRWIESEATHRFVERTTESSRSRCLDVAANAYRIDPSLYTGFVYVCIMCLRSGIVEDKRRDIPRVSETCA